TAASKPITTPPLGVTNPHAGVIATSPATAPEQNPRTLALPRRIFSRTPHVNEAIAVAIVVVVNAFAAITSAPTALPALNPYQPTHSMPVPTMHRTVLCGGIGSLPKPLRLPRIRHKINADQPEDI